jgi:hypothetical protein
MNVRHVILPLLGVTALLAACEGDETGPAGHASIAGARLYRVSSGQQMTPDVVLSAGDTLRVEVRFVDSSGTVIHGLEDGHHTSLGFSPATLVTVDTVPGMRFFRDLAVSASPASGTLTIGYGHSLAADELTFGPFTVTVQ